MNHNYPEYILETLRERYGLEDDDTSRDEEFQAMSPEEVFEEVLNYEGLIGYGRWIIGRIEAIFKVNVVAESESKDVN